jgi:hypothetical protein
LKDIDPLWFVVLRTEARASHIIGKCLTTEQQLRPYEFAFIDAIKDIFERLMYGNTICN